MSRDKNHLTSSSSISDEAALELDSILQRTTQHGALNEIPVEELSKEAAEHVTPLLNLVRDLSALRQSRRIREKPFENFSVPQQLGDFEILREIGRGGMGVVYEARQKSLDRIVALKILPRQSGKQEEIDRFRREATIAASLHHSNVVPIFAYGESDGYYYFAMQIIRGCSLNDVARRIANIPSPHIDQWIASVGIQVADALEYAHQRHMLHRDIKPSNLLLDDNGRVWVSDFGLACVFATTPEDFIGQSGTLHYQAPERRNGICDIRSEIFSLGTTLLDVAGGIDWEYNPKFNSGEQDSRTSCPSSENRPHRPQHLPLDLLAILNKAVHPDPELRYSTAAEFASDLRRFQAGYPVSARRIGWMGYLYRWARRNPSLAVSVSLIAVLILATTGVLLGSQIKIRSMNEKLVKANDVLMAHNRSLTQASFAVDALVRRAVEKLDVTQESTIDDQFEQFLKGSASQFRLEFRRDFPLILEGMMSPKLQLSDSGSSQEGSEDDILAASASRRIGNVMHSLGYFAEAEAAAKYSLMRIANFESNDPDLKSGVHLLKSQIFNDLAELEENRLQYEAADQYQKMALAELEQCQDRFDQDQYLTEFGRAHLGLANRWREQYSSIRLLQRALRSLDPDYQLPPADYERHSSYHRVAIRKYLITEQYEDEENSTALLLTANCLIERAQDEYGPAADRERDFKLGIHYLNLAVASSHWNPRYVYGLARGLNTVPLFAWEESDQVDPEIASPMLKLSHSLLGSLSQGSTPSPEVLMTLTETKYKIATISSLTGDPETADHFFNLAIELLDSMLTSPSLKLNPQLLLKKSIYHTAYALHLERNGRKEDSLNATNTALQALDALPPHSINTMPVGEIRRLIEWKFPLERSN